MIDPATALAFSMFENKGVYALLLGSGVSRAAQIPTGWQIVETLTRRVAALEGAGEVEDWESWHLERFGEAPSYSRLIEMLAKTPEEAPRAYHGFIAPSAEDIDEGRRVPTKAHHAIARLVRDGYVRVIVTTNFDRLLENALTEVGVAPTVIKSEDDLQGALPLIHTSCFILKVHGDYVDTRLRNTEGELAGYTTPFDQCLDRIFDEHGLVVCGWSADWDHALRAAITRTPTRRFSTYWASRGEPTGLAADLVAHRGGRIAPIGDADGFFEKLQQDIETQTLLQKPNPENADLLVASAKRYLAKPEHRIQLSNLLATEARRAARRVADAAFDVNGRVDEDEVRRRLAIYEAAYEPLTRILYMLGRWGGDDNFSAATDILQSLARSQLLSGSTLLIGLMDYPAVLALYAYGLGLTKANRRTALRRWLETPLTRERRELTPKAVDNLYLTGWEYGPTGELMAKIAGTQIGRAGVSDYLATRLNSWVGSEFHSRDDFEAGFDAFEAFATLAWIGINHSYETLDAAKASQERRWGMSMNIGRVVWRRVHQSLVLDLLAGPDHRDHTVNAGFAKAQLPYLDRAAELLRPRVPRCSPLPLVKTIASIYFCPNTPRRLTCCIATFLR